MKKKNIFNKRCKKEKRSMKGLNTKGEGGGGGWGKKKGFLKDRWPSLESHDTQVYEKIEQWGWEGGWD